MILTTLRDDDTQICSCHNVTKGDVVKVTKDGTCKSIGDVKSCTKAGTGCGGCMPLVQSIFNKQMKAMGSEVLNHSEYETPSLQAPGHSF
jgi:nitrite reductase (NAD(P)H)